MAGTGVFIDKIKKRSIVLSNDKDPAGLARDLFEELLPNLKSLTAKGQRGGTTAVPPNIIQAVKRKYLLRL